MASAVSVVQLFLPGFTLKTSNKTPQFNNRLRAVFLWAQYGK
jgi:hypothetical protein